MNNALSIFANALASESISFSFNAKAETASFDVKSRHLVLPVWNVSETVQTMLIAHEISHALWTPYDRSKTLLDEAEEQGYIIPLLQRIANCVEDNRIEKMMKDKFPGTRRDFFLGYREIADKDLFAFSKMDFSKMDPVSKCNLFIKWGMHQFIDLNLSNEEQEMLALIDTAESFDDTIRIAKALYDHPLMQQLVKKVQQEIAEQQALAGSPSELDAIAQKVVDKNAGDGTNPSEFAKHSGEEVYCSSITIPEIKDLKNAFIPTSYYMGAYDRMAAKYEKPLDESAYRQYLKDSEGYIRMLAAQFDRRKAADEIRKERPKQTGQLNLDRLHQYRTHDDIFLSKIIKQDGKNHGIVFLIDFSGSMSGVIGDAFLQIVQLVSFCEKVKIPFEVFGFTDGTDPRIREKMDEFYNNPANRGKQFEITHTLIEPVTRNLNDIQYGAVNMMQLASSQDSAEFRHRLLAYIYDQFVGPSSHGRGVIRMGGTPTVEALAVINQFVREWVSANDIQIPTVMVVTDGCPNGVYTIRGESEQTPITYMSEGGSVTVNNKILNTIKRMSAKECNHDITRGVIGTMLDSLREKFNARLVGMYVGGRSLNENTFLNFCIDREEDREELNRIGYRSLENSPRYEAAATKYKEEGCIIVHDSVYPGYDAFFYIKTPKIVKDEDAIADGGTFTRVKNTFIRTMAKRSGSRVFLSRYVDIVAGQPIRKGADSIYSHPLTPHK